MELHLKNIGKVKSAKIQINGITVIAGPNNTGKSTFGRALYAVFNSLYKSEEQIKEYRADSIEAALFLLWGSTLARAKRPFLFQRIAETIVENCEEFKKGTKEQFVTLFRQYDDSMTFEKQLENQSLLSECVSTIKDVLNVSDKKIQAAIFERRLDSEFNGQVRSFLSEEQGEIKLIIQKQSFSVGLTDTGIRISSKTGFDLHTEAVYIDDPFIIDDVPGRFVSLYGHASHRERLLRELYPPYTNENVVKEIISGKRLDKLYEKISSVCDGELVSQKRNELGYRKTDSEKVLDLRNLSTGLKTFVILKILLTKGKLEKNGTIILDEPEIHLHPEWQVLFAELIVLLQKEFGMHILLNTHSPYFLRAIQVFAGKHGIDSNCKYYLSGTDGKWATIRDVSSSVNDIFELLARPFQELEDIRWMDD